MTSRRGPVREGAAVLVVLIAALAVLSWQWQRPEPRTGTADSYWYLTDAARFAGSTEAVAATEAGRVYCAELQRSYRLGARPRGCVAYVAEGVSPRYRAIFASRPGFPVAAAPWVRALGLARGAALTTGLFFLAVALAGYAALRAGGAGRVGSVVTGVALAVLPLGFWDSRLLAEGAAQAGVLAAVLACVLLLRRRSRVAAAGLAAALSWVYVTKPAAAAALALTLAAGALVALAWRLFRGRHDGVRTHPGGWPWIGAVSAVVTAAWFGASQLLHLPSLTETVQDMATRHFRSPDVPDPLPYLVHRSLGLWWHLPRVLEVPWPFAVVAVACVVAVRRARGAGVIWSAAALSGVLVVSAHPLRSEYPRLIASTWIVVAAAIGLACDRLVGGRATPPPAGTPPEPSLPRTRPAPPAG